MLIKTINGLPHCWNCDPQGKCGFLDGCAAHALCKFNDHYTKPIRPFHEAHGLEEVTPRAGEVAKNPVPVMSGTDGQRLTDDPIDPVNHPAHYTAGGIECIDAIRAALSKEEFRGFCKGNALKYIWRERLKGKCDEDIAKAQWYLNELPAIL